MVTIAALVEGVRAAAPDRATAEEGEAYVGRLMAACLNDALLGHLQAQDGFTCALPTRGAANPDYILHHAALNTATHYRIEGQLNGSERVAVGLYRLVDGGGVELVQYTTLNVQSVTSDGRFTIAISPVATEHSNSGQCALEQSPLRQNLVGSSTLQLQPDSTILLVRTLHRRGDGVPARLSLVGGSLGQDLLPNGDRLDRALAQVSQAATRSVHQFLQWSALASATPNQFCPSTDGLTQTLQGDPDTDYYLGYYDLTDGQSLEIVMPRDLPGYWSLHAYNHWGEYLPGASADDRSSQRDSSGDISLIIHSGPMPPLSLGRPSNSISISTQGRLKGMLVCRIIGAELDRPPLARLMRQSQ